MDTPLFITVINLESTMRLDSGRAWVGFTAATGDDMWQVHDVLGWSYVSMRREVPYSPPVIVGGMGAAQCSDEVVEAGECPHL